MKDDAELVLEIVFFKTSQGREPVREWLKSLDRDERTAIGEDMRTIQFGWPIGMPLARKISDELWEVRSKTRGKIARVFFAVVGTAMVLLHGFFKKSQKTPREELETAQKRWRIYKKEGDL